MGQKEDAAVEKKTTRSDKVAMPVHDALWYNVFYQSAQGLHDAAKALDQPKGVDCQGLRDGIQQMGRAVESVDPFGKQFETAPNLKGINLQDLKTKVSPSRMLESAGLSKEVEAAKKKCGITPSATK